VQAGSREAEEKHYADDRRESTCEPLQDVINMSRALPLSFFGTHRFEAQSDEPVDHYLTLAEQKTAPA
jgi:hypothetical protein